MTGGENNKYFPHCDAVVGIEAMCETLNLLSMESIGWTITPSTTSSIFRDKFIRMTKSTQLLIVFIRSAPHPQITFPICTYFKRKLK